MLKLATLALFVGVASPLSLSWAQTNKPAVHGSAVTEQPAPLAPDQADASPAEKRMAAAKQQIAKDPKHTEACTDLVLACIRRARETGDPAWYQEAETALARGLSVAPGDFQLRKAGVALLLGREQFTDALTQACQLNLKNLDDVTVYGYMAEADLALGKYAEAETAAQWMLNMRPNNLTGLLLGAELRVAYGDAPGALEFLNQAFSETPQVETEELSSIANRIALVALEAGQVDRAAQALARAEELFPNSPVTRENLARVRLDQNKPEEAIHLLQQRVAEESAVHASQTRTLFLLALAEKQAGKSDPAFARFRESALASADKPVNDNVDLILFDAGLPGEPAAHAAEALQIAEREIAVRQDVSMLDAYAWALYANGRYAEANTQIHKALAVGVHSARVDEHAGEIAQKLNQPGEAARVFAAALQADPASPYALEAGKQLGGARPALVAAAAARDPARMASPVLESPRALLPQPAVATAALALTHDAGELPSRLLIPRPTGTERTIKKMQGQVAAHPQEASGYSGLGAAFFQRARETGEVEDYDLAEQALNKSLDLVSTDLSSTAPLETMAEVCMGEHRFTDALNYAQKALALGSGDLSAFAIVGDAYADMGEYEKASFAYSRLQPITDASPDAHQLYAQETRVAYLKFVSGDTASAIAEMKTAVSEGITAHLPGENLAWLYYELGEFSYQAGDMQAAGDAYLTALTVYPGDYRALAGLGKVRASQQKYPQAITLYQSAIAVIPMPIYIAELGDVYARIGNPVEAEKQYKLVEYIGRLGHINQVLHNRDLALFYADHDRNLEESLALAHKEFEVRSDIYTWDALAWSLYKSKKFKEADEAMSHALRLGTKDPMLLFHAGMISARAGQQTRAASQLSEALMINPHFHPRYAEVASKQLLALQDSSALPSSTFASASRSSHAR